LSFCCSFQLVTLYDDLRAATKRQKKENTVMTNTTANAVLDGTKMDNEQLGKLTRRTDELKRRINEGTLEYDWVMDELQRVIEGPKSETPIAAIIAEQSHPAPLPMSIIVDCDLNPNVPSGLYLTGEGTEHRKMGKITLEKREDGKLYANGVEVVRYLSPNQQNGKSIQGHKLRKELKDKQVLNACIMDALRANPQLIPDEWKFDYAYFWGTTFRHANGGLCVEYLYWFDGQWLWRCHWLGNGWHSSNPAAVLAS
jgi:hypothetical protein